MRQLTSFSITVRDEDFVLHLEVDGGETIELATSADQLDGVIGALSDLIEEDDDDDEVDGEVYQKPLG
ncbi:MAG: hypothetical protein JWO33_942 [Caulobacteraceae bacterium]|nr:hypothetical protein [Caulobacteraceae bacterium]